MPRISQGQTTQSERWK